MQRSFSLLLTLLGTCLVSVSPLQAAGSARENQRLQEGKITKNEAEHLVLKEFPAAKINSCRLTGAKNHSIWVLDIVKAGAHEHTKLQVDGRTGKILP